MSTQAHQHQTWHRWREEEEMEIQGPNRPTETNQHHPLEEDKGMIMLTITINNLMATK